MMQKPVNNNCLIEVIDDYSGLSSGISRDQQRGIVRDYNVSRLHLTASTGFVMTDSEMKMKYDDLKDWVGREVRYALYADSDSSVITEGGKKFVLIPWYRVLSVSDEKVDKK